MTMSACNHYMKLIFSLLAIMCLVACAGQETETQQPEDMIISVDFLERHLCSRVSPEITVACPKRHKILRCAPC